VPCIGARLMIIRQLDFDAVMKTVRSSSSAFARIDRKWIDYTSKGTGHAERME
jgi:hypothetical protein